jgi:UDP-N-acetyl-D-glucosamine dehydrogenase
MPFYPGPGLGGHCIPIDPFYLTWKAREYGQHTRFIELAGEINTSMPLYVVNRVAEALNARRKAINGSRILLLGLAYKPNVDDPRESPTFVLMDLLKDRGAEIAYYDPHVPVIGPTREHAAWAGLQSISWNAQAVAEYDAVVVATAHDAVNYKELVEWATCIIDTRNALADLKTQPGTSWKA